MWVSCLGWLKGGLNCGLGLTSETEDDGCNGFRRGWLGKRKTMVVVSGGFNGDWRLEV